MEKENILAPFLSWFPRHDSTNKGPSKDVLTVGVLLGVLPEVGDEGGSGDPQA